jgi:hypothetical protein
MAALVGLVDSAGNLQAGQPVHIGAHRQFEIMRTILNN